MRSWPTARREDLLAVAYFDMAVARRNMADLTRYLDIQSTHIAACSGALDDNLPLLSAETSPRLTGGIRSALDEADQNPEGASAVIVLVMGPAIKLELCDCLSDPRLYYHQPPPREV